MYNTRNSKHLGGKSISFKVHTNIGPSHRVNLDRSCNSQQEFEFRAENCSTYSLVKCKFHPVFIMCELCVSPNLTSTGDWKIPDLNGSMSKFWSISSLSKNVPVFFLSSLSLCFILILWLLCCNFMKQCSGCGFGLFNE